MRMIAFADRNRKELLRDPLSLVFGIGLPLVLLVVMSFINRQLPVSVFSLELFSPGIAVFSLSFITMFAGMLLGKDRESSFLVRLFASPLKARDFVLGYSLPLLPMAMIQCLVCFLVAVVLGLTFSVNILMCLVGLLPIALFFIGLGLLFGSIFSDRQVGGVTSVVIQVVAFTSGMWFDLSLIGGVYQAICQWLPFYHAVEATRSALAGQYAAMSVHMLWCAGYAIVILALAIWAFRKKMKG